MEPQHWVNIGLGNDLLPDSTKPLPEPILTWSSARSNDNHLRTNSQGIPKPSITEVSFQVNHLKFHSILPGANELGVLGLGLLFEVDG